MKKILSVLCLGVCLSANAESPFLQRFGENLEDEQYVFQEESLALPALPDPQSADWVKLPLEAAFQGSAYIFPDSIVAAPDGSIRYIVNARSPSGYDNITAEGLLCVKSTSIVASEPVKWKAYAFGDTAGKRWITARRPQWRVLADKPDPLRTALYEAFCRNGKLNSSDELRKALHTYIRSVPSYNDR